MDIDDFTFYISEHCPTATQLNIMYILVTKLKLISQELHMQR